ncbi:putative molybdenum carrier protein [Prosthecochloris sp. N3]|uniref:Molybdenum carrier protein n=1 Tax=Prosthecochloris ethylica TaxID=2743976 RepID=A0ABR9XQ32_9CHLB|nr:MULTISPECIES: putative molybdenum carrier protein [Prosthecochloris]MEC9487717.1 putative molybdenum carrier protein [Prosthecochloris sp.]MBF0587262.1 putative molybdenum carrier protein [Prosthecochloris ethylica]MBF0636044.1 putative molybdenum carrier protein [Prosthecochloris ethylica]NUK48471.1 molybdenum cofactor carrier [Prosthecochloris ethylica]RNA64461.1 molybdenum cofactor carrier [Prosthecochloris sp. ZM_2]
MLRAIVSGGQTGVDRAALDTAIRLRIPHGGWCPRGRRAEDGVIDGRYQLQQTPLSRYDQRTRWNVRDADATLILVSGEPTGGTRLTRELARSLGKPCLVVDPRDIKEAQRVAAWLRREMVEVLNIAGPRGSTDPAIYDAAKDFLEVLFSCY